MKIKSSSLEYDLTIKALWLNKVENKTLAEISKHLLVSPAKVHRLINFAEESGLIKVWLNSYPADCLKIANEIKDNYSLKNCHVVPDAELGSESQSIQIVGHAAARVLFHWLTDEPIGTIGVGKGRTLKCMANSLPRIHCPKIDFVAISGSLKPNHAVTKEDVIHQLADKTTGKGYLLPHPHFATDIEKKKKILTQYAIQELHHKGRKAKKIIVGIGNTRDNPYVKHYSLIEDRLWQEILSRGATSEFLGSFLDINGQTVNSKAKDLALGLAIDDLHGKTILAVVGGKNKGKATLSALEAQVITDLVIGETSARQVLIESSSLQT